SLSSASSIANSTSLWSTSQPSPWYAFQFASLPDFPARRGGHVLSGSPSLALAAAAGRQLLFLHVLEGGVCDSTVNFHRPCLCRRTGHRPDGQPAHEKITALGVHHRAAGNPVHLQI